MRNQRESGEKGFTIEEKGKGPPSVISGRCQPLQTRDNGPAQFYDGAVRPSKEPTKSGQYVFSNRWPIVPVMW
jgi:hypothetical protein